MKKAFTMIEIIFVILVIGILAAVIASRGGPSSLDLAAEQVAQHIRYTQHLAMVDDVYDPNDSNWYKKRWQIYFNKHGDANGKWGYIVFSDSAGDYTGNPSKDEIAKDPLSGKYISNGFTGLTYNSGKTEKSANLGETYGIGDISLESESNGCSVSQRLAFDYLGRPVVGNSTSLKKPYKTETLSRLMKNQCRIVLKKGDESKIIYVEPETGYVHF
ncbi:MAG: type II secretion system protein [Sulfuricurvum sp.]